jgi:hypothetical protein
MNQRIRKHKKDRMVCRWTLFSATSTIPKDMGRDDMNSYVVHVICYDCSILPSKENQISFWVNCNHSVVINTIHVTKSNINSSKQDPCGDRMLQCPIISTIVFKDLDWKLGIIGTSNSTYTQVTLSLMHGVLKTIRPINFSPCVSLHIHSKYHRVLPRVPHNVQTTVKKHTWLSIKCHISVLVSFRFLIDPCCSLRWVDLHTCAHSIDIHIFNHMEVWEGCRIEPQSSITNSMANIMGARW